MAAGITHEGNVTYTNRRVKKFGPKTLTAGSGWSSEWFKLISTRNYKGFSNIFTYMQDLKLITETRPRKTFKYTYQSWRGFDQNEINTRILGFDQTENTEFKEITARLISSTKTKTFDAMLKLVWTVEYNTNVLGLKWWDREPHDILFRGQGTAGDRNVLLTALLRTAGIPARNIEGTWNGRPHAWTEVWYRNGYRVLDPTNPAFIKNGFIDMSMLNAQINRNLGYNGIAELALNTSDVLDSIYYDAYIR